MNSISEEVSRETLEMMLRMFGLGLEMGAHSIAALGEAGKLVHDFGATTVEDIMKIFNNTTAKIFEKDENTLMDGSLSLDYLLNHMGKDTLYTVPLPDEEAEVTKKYLRNMGVNFATLDVGYDDIQVVLFLSSDAKKVEKALLNSQTERGVLSEVSPSLFLDSFQSENLGTLSGLSNTELELFRRFSAKDGLVFTSIPEGDTNKIVYNLADSNVAKKAAADVLWSSLGDEGEIIRKQLELKLKNRQTINRAFLDAEKEYYIVSGKNPQNFVHVTTVDFEYYKHSKKVNEVDRDERNFMDRAIQTVNGLVSPVVFEKDQYENASDEERSAFIKNQLEASFNDDVLQKAIDEAIAKRVLVEEKMALDDEMQDSFWIFDSSISFSEASTNETFNDLDDDQREKVGKALEARGRYVFENFEADDKRLDRLIEQAEKQRAAGYQYAGETPRTHDDHDVEEFPEF